MIQHKIIRQSDIDEFRHYLDLRVSEGWVALYDTFHSFVDEDRIWNVIMLTKGDEGEK